MAEVGVAAEDERGARLTVGAPDLLTLHESIAGMFATQGDWQRAYQHLRSALDIARAGSLRDTLTSSYNRRYLDQRLPSLPSGRGLALALIDLDRFKHVNDTYGHLLGDRVLCRVADLLQEDLPADGFCARYGGEEFVLVLPGLDAAGAIRLADATRVRVARHPWSELQPGLRVTISVGLAYASADTEAAQRQLLRADNLLYAAKRAGRNRVAYHDRETARVITHSE
ncbi:GGDEF domain-containing protein [Amycolatopsis saalfeldensis]|uniref:GGDEF domain-containing protein n=1 Tax=Amycolatopsis saalfeldensis TaxID=394193 RepID=UPI0015A55E65|nr:GGDEF domain-containing protein [Amycolatopsis saalfeldensis]